MVTKIKFSDFRSIIKCPCAPPFCGYCEPLSSSFQPHRFPLKSPTGRGFSPFPFLPSAGRRATAIQFYLLVHIDIFYDGHAFGVRVDGPLARGLWPPDGGRLCTRVVSPQGETTHYILCVAPLLHPLLSLTHWIFRSLMLPYKSSSHSAKCVRCASLRSGGDGFYNSAPIPVISTEAKRSGEISLHHGTGGIGGGRSLDSEYHGSNSCLFPIPACSSARDDGGDERPSRHVYKKGARLRRGLCRRVASHRENDSLHFVRRSAPSSTAVTDSLDFQVADAPLQIQFA